MDRSVELLSLRDVRDLEMAKICINQKRQHDWWDVYQPQIDNLAIGNFKELIPIKGEQKSAVQMTIGLIVGLLLIIAAIVLFCLDVGLILPLILVIAGSVLIWLMKDDYFYTLKAAVNEKKISSGTSVLRNIICTSKQE